jgi:hypothetical protein
MNEPTPVPHDQGIAFDEHVVDRSFMTKAFYRSGVAFCAAVEAFAPLTRKQGRGVVDLRPATLTVKADRLQSTLRLAEQGLMGLSVSEVDSFVTAITALLVEWRDQRGHLDGTTSQQLTALLEQGELMLSLLSSAQLGVAAEV